MRWAWIVALCIAAGPAAGKPLPPAEPASTGDFWRDVIEPHGTEVAAIIARARSAIAKAAEAADGEDTIERRNRHLTYAYSVLRHARKLSPENLEVLRLLGSTADELGKTREALDALEACMRIAGPERAGLEVTARLGMIDLRLGKLDDAIRWLRYVQNPLAGPEAAVATVHLATALAARGDMAQAIDVLVNTLPSQVNYFTEAITLVSFALAVNYDRDEQRGAAFEVLDRMQGALQQELGPLAQRALAIIRFVPAEDEYYYLALLYEALGDYAEARAEWALYASVLDAPWRRRALDHIRAIDDQRSAPAATTAPGPARGTRAGRAIPTPAVP